MRNLLQLAAGVLATSLSLTASALTLNVGDQQSIADAQKTIDFFSGLGLIKSYPAPTLFDESFAAALQPAVAKAGVQP